MLDAYDTFAPLPIPKSPIKRYSKVMGHVAMPYAVILISGLFSIISFTVPIFRKKRKKNL